MVEKLILFTLLALPIFLLLPPRRPKSDVRRQPTPEEISELLRKYKLFVGPRRRG